VSADGTRWFLLNASPDVRAQIACLPGSLPAGLRHVPVEGVVVTDAELDHTLGIVLLREARQLQLYGTPATLSILERDSRLLPVTRSFADVAITEIFPGQRTELRYRDGGISGLSIEPFDVPAGPPRFAPQAAMGHTVGLMLQDDANGGTCAFVPGCGDLDSALLQRLAETDLLLFDGTFWSDDEMQALGIGERSARDMDHLPVSGPGGSLAQLAQLRRPRTVYTHINNTNPMLLEDSPQQAHVQRAGLQVGADGMSFLV
jgi:pyrroloquinoline quinone biosynthesis protein B